MQSEYWARIQSRRWSRRTALRTVGVVGAAAAAVPLGIGCGGDDNNGGKPAANTAVTGGSPSASTNQPKMGGVARQAQGEPPHFDPHTETMHAGYTVSLVHAALLRFKQSPNPNDLIPEGYLAESFEQADPTTLTLKLRPNATFQDVAPVNGRKVTADDVKFSFERIKTDKPEFQRKTFFAAVDRIEAVDATTARFKLSKPFAPLSLYLADTWNAIIPKEVVAAKGDLREPSAAIGAGPFLFGSYDKGVGIKLTRNPKFWVEGKPYISDVQLAIMLDPVAILAAFKSRQLEIMRGVPWSEVNSIKGDPSMQIQDYSNIDLQYIRINTKKTPLDDPRVRRALSMAIDRTALGNSAFQGNGVPAGVFPQGVKFAVKPDDLPNYEFNIKDAKALLASAGYPDGIDLENLTNPNPGNQQSEVTVAIDQLRQAGFRVKNKSLEYGAYLQAAFNKEFEINIHWGNSYVEPDGYAIEYLQDGGRNFGYWGSNELDDMINAQRELLDEDERAQKMVEIQKVIADQMYTIGLTNWKTYDAWTKKLQNFSTSVHWFRPTQEFADTWLSA